LAGVLRASAASDVPLPDRTDLTDKTLSSPLRRHRLAAEGVCAICGICPSRKMVTPQAAISGGLPTSPPPVPPCLPAWQDHATSAARHPMPEPVDCRPLPPWKALPAIRQDCPSSAPDRQRFGYRATSRPRYRVAGVSTAFTRRRSISASASLTVKSPSRVRRAMSPGLRPPC